MIGNLNLLGENKMKRQCLVIAVVSVASCVMPSSVEGSYYFGSAPIGGSIYTMVGIWETKVACDDAKALYQRNSPHMSVSDCTVWVP